MKLFFEKLLKSFEYDTILEFGHSLMPSSKYQVSVIGMMISAVGVPFEKFLQVAFGLDRFGLTALLLAFILELGSGIVASLIRKEAITSQRFSRFTAKTACYLVLIAIPNMLGQSLMNSDRGIIATSGGTVLDWMSIFLILHITQENLVSVLENLSVISGKDKTHWITAITTKLKSILK